MAKRMHVQASRPYLLVMALFVAVTLVLVGCGSGQQTGQQEAKVREMAFTGREERDPSELEEYIEKALDLAEERKSASSDLDSKEETELIEAQSEAFSDANELYRKGKYKKAQAAYEAILEEYPGHYGANVNLTLALLQQVENDDALVQALSCLSLFAKDKGEILNVQAAAVACGFSAETVLEDAALVVMEKANSNPSLMDALDADAEYNKVWDKIETQLYDIAKGKAKDGEEVYHSLLEDIDVLAEGDLADDEDVQALRAYLEAVGVQLKLEDAEAEKAKEEDKKEFAKRDANKDEAKSTTAAKEATDVDLSAAETHKGLPYVVADDDLCTFVFTGYHMAGDNPVAEFEMVNNSNGRILFSGVGEVTGNGKEIQNLSVGWPGVEPGEQDSGWGSFFANVDGDTVSVLDGDLTSLSFVVKVKNGSSPNSSSTSYPFKWEADATKAAKETDQLIIDGENGVKMRLTRYLPAADGIVAVEYWGAYSGDGKALVDGSGWKANGKDVTLLGIGSPMGTGTAGHHYLLFHANNDSDLRDEELKTLSGTLILTDEDGKELVNKNIDVSFGA